MDRRGERGRPGRAGDGGSAAPAGVLFAVRSGEANGLPFEPARLPVPPTTITLSALDLDVCSELVRARFGGGLSQTLLRAIWDSAAGNPLTVLELARAMADRRAEPLPTSLPLAGLGDALEHHLRSLPAAGQQAAAVASALGRPTRAEVTQIARTSSLTVDLDVAVDDGVLVAASPGGIAFAHPLLRAAAYARTRETLRRAIPAAAATTCDSASERAWHLAETAEGPDETPDLLAGQGAFVNGLREVTIVGRLLDGCVPPRVMRSAKVRGERVTEVAVVRDSASSIPPPSQ